jgi:hypothetical protein
VAVAEKFTKGKSDMTDSGASFVAILFGLGVFAVIVAIGWRSVQNRRILRLRDADGQETIIIAGEDDDVSSIVTTTTTETAQTATAPAPPAGVADTGIAEPAPAPEFGRKVT